MKDQPLHKYDGKEFLDPIVRCDNCAALVHREFIGKHAGCNHCGNKRFKNVQGLSGPEHIGLTDGTYDLGLKEYVIPADFLAIFQEVSA